MRLPPRQILLLGPPGSGKGTQARRLSRHLAVRCCSTGNVLRQEEIRQSKLGQEIQRFLRDGHFVPDDLVLKIIFHWLQNSEPEFVLDGFPRTLAQGGALDRFLMDSHRSAVTAVYLDVPLDILEQRVLHRVGCDPCGNVWTRSAAPARCPDCGRQAVKRPDDSNALFRARLAEYREKTLPLLPYYEENNRLRRICGRGSPSAVFQRIVTALDS